MPDKKFDVSHKDHLDRPERLKEYDLEAIFDGMGLNEGQTVADIGAGTGFFTIPMAERVGPSGKVIAVDISAEMLERIHAKLGAQGISNVELVLSEEDHIGISDGTADIALMSSVFHELSGFGTLNEVGRILKPGGKLAVIDWMKKLTAGGPPFWHRMKEEEVRQICEDAGFEFQGEFETGSDTKYGLLFSNL